MSLPVRPVTIFKRLKLVLCGILRRGRPMDTEARTAPDLPHTAEEARATAARAGFAIPEPCLPGVVASLALLERHAATLRQRP